MNDFHESVAQLAWSVAGATSDELSGLVVDAIAGVAARVAADRAYVTLYHDDGTFRNLYEWTADSVVPQLPSIQRLQSSDFAYSYELARRGEVLAAPDLDDLPTAAAAERRSFSSFGVRAVLQVPIVVDGTGIGLIGVNHFDVVDGWSSDDIAAIRDVGQAISTALVRELSRHGAQRAADEVERAREAKGQLLAHVSHELRTPLHGLLGYAELLELTAQSDQDRVAVTQIEASGRRLLAMIDDLIDLAATSDHRTHEIPLGPVVAAAAEGLGLAAGQRRVTMSFGGHLARATVRGELGRVRQVIFCAMSGAVQAIDGGGAIVIDATPGTVDANASDTVLLHVDAERPMPRAAMVMPLAEALVEGHGSIELTERSGGFDVRIEFAADPAAP